jgi:hypothetical protein
MDSPGTTAIMNKLKHYLIQPPSISKIRVQFENSITVNEDSIASILSNLKVKTKWDYKEKSKKQGGHHYHVDKDNNLIIVMTPTILTK